MNDDYKTSLFNEASMMYAEAVESYEIGEIETARDYENRFNAIFNLIQRFGWAEEYMGI